MAAPRQYGEDLREAIHTLVNENKTSVPQAHKQLQATFEQVPSIPRIREIAREEKNTREPPLSLDAPDEQLRKLTNGIVDVAYTEILRMQAEKDAVDADQLLKLANTVKTLEPLLKPEPSKDTGNKPASFLEVLPPTQHADENDAHKGTSAAGTGDRSLCTQAA